MSKLIYLAITSLDGFIEDEQGSFDWAMPDAEVHDFVNEISRTVGTELYGRRMYETMAVWETIGDQHDVSAEEAAFAADWRSTDKIVYSRTLDAVTTSRTTLERDLDPEQIGRLKESAERDVSISGPGLAAHAFRAGLVDDVHLFAFPIVVGGGKPGIPRGIRVELELVDQHRFDRGVVHTHYRVR